MPGLLSNIVVCYGINNWYSRNVWDHIMWKGVSIMVNSSILNTLSFPSPIIRDKGCMHCRATLLFVTHALHRAHPISTVVAWFLVVWRKFIIISCGMEFWYVNCWHCWQATWIENLLPPTWVNLRTMFCGGKNGRLCNSTSLHRPLFQGIFCLDDWFEWSIEGLAA